MNTAHKQRIRFWQVWRGLIALNMSTVTGVIDVDVTAEAVNSPSTLKNLPPHPEDTHE